MTPFSFIIDLFFPRFCFSCHKPGSYICYACQQKLKALEFDICPYCRKKSYFGLTHPGCKKINGLDGLKSILKYDGVTKKIIKQIKYKLVRDAIHDFIQAIPYSKKEELLLFKKLYPDWYVIPVPLHERRYKQRVFNQSELLGKYIAEMLHFNLETKYVKRTKNTPPQVTTQNDKQRVLNMKDAFEMNQNTNIEGRHIILFDDVFTTGSTMFEIAKVLKRAGAEKVIGLTIAR